MPDSTFRTQSKVIIVEDEVLIAADLEMRLERLGYIVSGKAVSGEESLELADQHRPDLIMMDIVLRGEMDGITAAEIIRDRWGIPIVFLTAYADTERFERAKLTYPFGYLLKPFQDRDLKVTIEMALYMAKAEKRRKRAEAEQNKLRGQLANALEIARLGHWEYDVGDDRFTFNDQFYKIFRTTAQEVGGYTMSSAEYASRFVHPEDISVVAEEIRKAIETTDANLKRQLEHRIIYADGTTGYISVLFFIVKDSNGRTIKTYGVNQDITEQKQAEQTLIESEERYRLLADNTLDAIWTMNLDLVFTYINPACEDITGFTPEEWIGTRLWEHCDEENFAIMAGVIAEELSKGVEGTGVVFEAEMIKKDGDPIWVEIHGNILFDESGQPVNLQGTTRDATDRKRAEEKLKKSEERFTRFMENLPGYAFIKDDQGRYVYINRAHGTEYDPTPEGRIGRTDREIFPPELADEYSRNDQVVLDTGQPMEVIETLYNGLETRHHLVTRFPIIYEDNQLFIGGLTLDITDRLRTDEEKENLRVQLQQAQKMEAVGTLAGGIAHDFNNLLQAINGYTQLMLLDKKEPDPDYLNLLAIREAGDRASELVRQLLLFSRKADTERRPVQLNQEIEQARRILERTIPKMINIDVHPGGRLWTIMADPVQIEQIILNLGTNAADAMPNGGTLVIETENIILEEEYARNHLNAAPGRYVLTTVSDTGHGVDPDTLDNIFEPFFTTKEFGKGTGLGLASVYGIIKNHGGYITCYSEVDMGTTFKIFLPAIDQEEVTAPKDVSTERPQVGTETILIVDDEASIRGFASQALKKFGYTVLTASTGEEALDIYSGRQGEIDLVIMDIGMPGMGGIQCLNELTRINPEALVLIASGYSINGQVKKTLESGASGYVGKPYELNDLISKVRGVLDRE